MVRPILESIVEDIKFEELPYNWSSLDTKSFSNSKRLWDFQEDALKNAIKCLYLFFKIDNADKSKFYQRYIANGLEKNLEKNVSIKLSKLKGKVADILQQYYPSENDIINFENFINRSAFWMATGSGKSLVLIKLIEILKKLMDAGEIPKRDILFLTHREDLIAQFKKHVNEFNELAKRDLGIKLIELTEYETVKRESLVPFSNEITVFYYRSDLISDEQKEKIIDFRNYENGGNWYIILDEAHKGDKEESKRQMLYSIMARNGFLFNFSATFVDNSDIITTVFNFNLERFVSEGYGKHIHILKQEIRAFKEKEDYNSIEKKKIVLKSLVLLTYIKKVHENAVGIVKGIYHEPLMLTLVNTVNLSEVKEEEPDLKLFFNELESIGKGDVDENLLKKSIEELLKEFSENPSFVYENIPVTIDENLLKSITLKSILSTIYNSDSFGSIEALTIPEKRQEVIFKLKTSDKPFALIKIGDAVKWIKDNLKGYEVNESYENKSIFERIEERGEISILMGSRAFYEGWDSNRPNLILFINIGTGTDAKKFVIQSIGRGIRIEPLKNKRKRLKNLSNKNEDDGILRKFGSDTAIQPLETLFVFGTNRNALKEVINTLRVEKELKGVLDLTINENVQSYTLLIPVYKESRKLYLEREPQKFPISENHLDVLREYFNSTDDRVIVVSHDISPELLQHIKKSFENQDKYYKLSAIEGLQFKTIISKIISHFNLNLKDLDKFKCLEDEIIHFKKIRVFFEKPEEQKELDEKIRKVANYPEKQKEEKKLKDIYGKVSPEEYSKLYEEISKKYSKEETFKDLRIKYVAEHYFTPLILSTKEKIDYIKHVIKTKSEINFINNLENFLENNRDKLGVDWWIFSKIDEYLDEVYIPYYDPESNIIRSFKPDFIFWLKRGDDYFIVFVDPKGIKHTDFEYKVDGFVRIFGKFDSPKIFEFENLKIRAYLCLFTDDKNLLAEGYKRYWFDSPQSIFELSIPFNDT
ncbi:MAG: DEAD/DEAH box helicase family protein [Thermoplasmatales archaeon]|nr:DEAD/DEAH box helicase family protein [Thermoplasmatales archaeon]